MTPLLAALALGAEPARAQERAGLEFEWVAPESCPTRSEVLREVERLAPTRPEAMASGAFEVHARVTQDNDESWRAEVRTRLDSFTGERTLRGEDCLAVANAVALVVALSLRRDARPEAPTSRRYEPSGAGHREPTVPRSKPNSDRDRIGVRGATAVGVGSLPGPALGGQVHGMYAAPAWSGELRAGAWVPRATTIEGHPEAGGRFTLFEGGLFACLRPRLGALRLDSCAGAALSYMRASGFGISSPERVDALWGNLVLEPGFALELSRTLALRLSGLWMRPWTRPRFIIENLGEVHRPHGYSLRAAFATELYW